MNNDERNVLRTIKSGEGLTVEFKQCQNGLSKDVYETVCSFLNRHGGTLLLGISDKGTVTGIAADAVEQIRKDFVTAINNPQKINPPAYLSIEEIALKGKSVLQIYIPESSQVHRCNGRIYDRNEDGDFDITDHTRLVTELYHRKQTTYSENKIYPFAGLKDMRTDLIARCRKQASVFREGHPWSGMDDLGLLKSAQLYQTDPETGKSGITLAGILLLGKDTLILSTIPHHRTDLILRKVNLNRYDDRDIVETNLIESYERIMAFVAKHLPDPFYLEGDTRISIRDSIFREVASNILIHREYMNPFPAKFIIESTQVRTENSNKPHGFGAINPTSFTPFPKNPVIARFFRQIGRADELGSGLRNMMKYGKKYGNKLPQLIEGGIFQITISIPCIDAQDMSDSSPQVTPQVTPQVRRMLEIIDREMTREQLMSSLALKDRKNFYSSYLDPAIKNEFIEMTEPSSPKSPTQKYRLTVKGRQILSKFSSARKIPMQKKRRKKGGLK